MRKRYFLIAFFIFTTILYLFYRSCKRDTLVIVANDRISIPDSAWLHGAINLEQIHKEVAWSALLNGTFFDLLRTDSTSNTLIDIIKSSDAYSVVEQNNIQYFSIWQDTLCYAGIIFQLRDNRAIRKSYKSDSILIGQKSVYAFRTKEGFWLHNKHNLLFVSKEVQDSITACNFFLKTEHLHTPPALSDSILLSCSMNTAYTPKHKHYLFTDSTEISFIVKRNADVLDIDWNYKGIASDFFRQANLFIPDVHQGFYFTCNESEKDIFMITHKTALIDNTNKQQLILIKNIASVLKDNTLTIEFNGWKKIKNSYYVNTMNDEFEMILEKKDTNFIEPIFRITLNQKEPKTTAVFLSYLQNEGLVSKKAPFKITYGNFDSELKTIADNRISIQNKHWVNADNTPVLKQINAAFFLRISPSTIVGLTDQTIPKPDFAPENEKLVPIKELTLIAQKKSTGLYGNMKIEFTETNYPLLTCIQLLKK